MVEVGPENVIAFLIVAPIVIGIGMLPTIVAYKTHHKNLVAIMITQIIGFFLWPLWVAALIWSFVK